MKDKIRIGKQNERNSIHNATKITYISAINMTRFHTYKPRKQIETMAPRKAVYCAKFGDS